jgi:hypothetical protein
LLLILAAMSGSENLNVAQIEEMINRFAVAVSLSEHQNEDAHTTAENNADMAEAALLAAENKASIKRMMHLVDHDLVSLRNSTGMLTSAMSLSGCPQGV